MTVIVVYNTFMEFNRNTYLWQPDTKDEDGNRIDPILVKDLTDSHLANIINWIADHPNWYDEGDRLFMINEARFRATAAFTDNKPYVQVKDDGRYAVVTP